MSVVVYLTGTESLSWCGPVNVYPPKQTIVPEEGMTQTMGEARLSEMGK